MTLGNVRFREREPVRRCAGATSGSRSGWLSVKTEHVDEHPPGEEEHPPAGEDADLELPHVPEPEPLVDEHRSRTFAKVARTVLPLLVGAGVVVVGVESAGSVRTAGRLLGNVQPRWLLLAVLC